MTSLQDQLPDESRLLFMLWGLVRFDPAFVADAIRQGKLADVAFEALATLIDGTHPKGIRLSIAGFGRNVLTLGEEADRMERAEKIVGLFDGYRASGMTWYEAVGHVADELQVSEPTVARELRDFGEFIRNYHAS